MVEMDLRQPYSAPCTHLHKFLYKTIGSVHLKSQGEYQFVRLPYAVHTHEVTYLPYGDSYKCNHATLCESEDCSFK